MNHLDGIKNVDQITDEKYFKILEYYNAKNEKTLNLNILVNLYYKNDYKLYDKYIEGSIHFTKINFITFRFNTMRV